MKLVPMPTIHRRVAAGRSTRWTRRVTPQAVSGTSWKRFSTTGAFAGRNRIYQRIPLITMFTASWCPSCKQVQPLIQRMIEQEGVGEDHGGLGFVEIEYDAPGNEELGMRYMVRSLPTLLAFSRGEAQLETKVTKVDEMRNPTFLKQWLETEAKRAGDGGAGGGAGILGSLFGKGG